MDTCDALVVGGGPAGSSCAWALERAGLDVVVLDRASFPRDKVCAGWVTPQVIRSLDLDTADYARGRTFQPITAFRTGLIGDRGTIDTSYDTPVSYGIRRCEFDHYLLQRSGARLAPPAPVTSMRRDGRDWIVNDGIRTPLVVGAGGHFCPVAKQLNPEPPQASLVVAQEVEFVVDAADAAAYAIAPERPELYFSRDLQGYGWCFRKGRHMNIGFGRLDRRSLPKGTAEFVEFLAREGRVPPGATYKWHGHAYLLASAAGRRVVDDGVRAGRRRGGTRVSAERGRDPAGGRIGLDGRRDDPGRAWCLRSRSAVAACRPARRAVRHRLGARGVVRARA